MPFCMQVREICSEKPWEIWLSSNLEIHFSFMPVNKKFLPFKFGLYGLNNSPNHQPFVICQNLTFGFLSNDKGDDFSPGTLFYVSFLLIAKDYQPGKRLFLHRYSRIVQRTRTKGF